MLPFLRQLPRQPLRSSQHISRFGTLQPLRVKEEKKDQSPEEIEKAKQNQHHDKDARRELKSGSEEVVGAEQESVKDHDKHMEELQKQTKKESEEKHPQAKS